MTLMMPQLLLKDNRKKLTKISRLNLVDLAGSERVRLAPAACV